MPTVIVPVAVGGRVLNLFVPQDAERLLDDPAVHARFAADEYMPYWAEIWPAGIAFAEYLLQHGPGVDPLLAAAARREVPVLELGAGVGVVGLALAAAGWRMVETDYDPEAMAFARASAAANAIAVEAVETLDWRKPPATEYPVIIAAEVLYERRHHEPIAGFLRARLQGGGAAFVGDACRAVADAFPRTAAAAGLVCSSTRWPVPPRAPGIFAGPLREVRVFRLTLAE